MSQDLKPLSKYASRNDCRQIARTLGEGTKFYIAKCHYTIGMNGGEEYLLAFNQIAEALESTFDKEQADGMVITQRFIYGVPKYQK